MNITGTHINYYNICKRKLWLFANAIQMEHTSEVVYEGKLLHETSYPQRSNRYSELEIEGIKIDFYDARNKIIHEIKKSDKIEKAHEWQVKYYIYILERNGITQVKGLLEYPKQKHTAEVFLSEDDRIEIQKQEKEIIKVVEQEKCPPVLNNKICGTCSYYEFCHVREEEP